MKLVAFTGHRPDKIGGYDLPNPTYMHVCQEIDRVLRELKPDKVISGMALGVDQWAANVALKLNIPFIAAVPFLGQEGKWPNKSQQLYKKMLEKAAEIVIVSEGGYAASKLQIRNEWMVDRCDVLVAVFDGTSGGTANCVTYAKGKGKEIVFIKP
jgi:uncharacterized phage-like protein YoqJ